MQLDIFEHSRDVVLRNAAIDALRERDTGACAQALAALTAEYGADPLLPAFGILCGKLHTPIPKPIARELAIAILQELDAALASAAHVVFGNDAQAWLSPFYAELAAAIAEYPFDSGRESLHATPLLLRARHWMNASVCIEAIASWRRQPAPLAWMIEARCHLAGFDAIMPLLAELAWMAPQRAQWLAPRLELPALDRLVRNFDAEFEGAGTPEDFTWFPAWALIADSRLAECLRLSQAGANTRAEYCARVVLDLLLFERQGRHAELIEGRRKLRALHAGQIKGYFMEWHDIRTALARMAPPFPLAAAEEARQRWDELASRFVAELERVAAGGSTLRDEINGEYDGLFSFAVYLAAEKRDSRAYAPLVRACHCSNERADELFADDAGIKLGRMLASVCDGDLAPLKALAEDSGAGLWCRYAALHALIVRVLEGDADRDSVLTYIKALCEQEANILRQAGPDEDGGLDDFLSWAIDTARELGPAPLLEDIRGWFDEGLIDPTVTGLKWFEKMAAMPLEDCLAEAAAKEDNRYIRDALDKMAGWFCYDVPESGHTSSHPASGWQPQDSEGGGTIVRNQPKVGRNDPCPCGSGKKFKKCCSKETKEPVAEEGKDGGVGKAIVWLSSRHAKAIKTSIAAMLNDDLDKEEQTKLQELDEDDWEGVQINAMEWLLAEGSIAVKGVRRNVAELLLGPGGPAFTPGQRSWIEQLSRQPLRLYDITEVLPGVGMRLCDALDTEAAPVMVYEKSGSAHAQIGNLIGVRIMEAGGHHEISGAAYPFSRLMNTSLLAELRAAAEDAAVQGEELSHRLSAIIRRCWIAQYTRPLPLPTLIDAHSGDPILLITDHYRVSNWDDLAAALKTQSDIEGDRASGWARLFACADGQTRQSVSINLGKSEDRIELFYKTQNYADQGRPWFEALAGKSVEFAGRVLSDPRSAMKHPPAGKPGASATTVPNLPPEVLAEAIEKVLRRTYANWSDEPVPALGGKTPRQALATASGRERVRGLLRSYEAGEKVQAAQQGRREISYAFLWEALELDRAAE